MNGSFVVAEWRDEGETSRDLPIATLHLWNASAAATRYLLVMGPKSARLVEAIHSTDMRGVEGMRALFRDYDAELLA